MKRKPMRPIDVVNHKIHREASTGGVPAIFMQYAAEDAKKGEAIPPTFAGPHSKLSQGKRRK